MKKAYSKPQIVFESFELTTSIAAGCKELASKETYERFQAEKEMDFYADENSCLEILDCYHVPIDGLGLFIS